MTVSLVTLPDLYVMHCQVHVHLNRVIMLILHSDWYHQYSDVIHRVLAIVTMRLCLQEYSISHPLCPPPLLTPLPLPLPSPPLPARFYHLFPALAEGAMDSLLDLVEEENDQVREGGGEEGKNI